MSISKMTQADYDRLSPPIQSVMQARSKNWIEYIYDERWLHVGYIPAPTTRLGWFVYHVVHGLAMRYPLLAVLRYALSNTGADTRGG